MTTTIRTIRDLERWREGAEQLFDDPADPICLLAVRWVGRPESYRGPELVCGNLVSGVMDLCLSRVASGGLANDSLPVPVHAGAPVLDPDSGRVISFGVERIGPGLWALTPSLNLPGVVHGFVILLDVPEPAPFGDAADVGLEASLAAPSQRLWTPGQPL